MEQLSVNNRFNYPEKKTFIFFAVAAVLVVAFFLAMGYKQDYFTRMTTLYLFSDNATGIKPGMAVKTLGFNIGKVDAISIEPNAKVRVKISIQSDHMRFITLDSRARLFKEGMIGESVIEISPGSQELRQMTHNAVLPFNRGRDLTELADELYKETQPILKGIGQTIAAVNNPEGDVQQSLHHVNQATKNVQFLTESLSSKLPSILSKAESITKMANDNLPGIMESTSSKLPSILGKAESITKTVNDNLPDIMDSSRKSLDNIRDATTDLKQMTSVSAQELPQTLRDGQSLVKGSLSIVNGIKETWPVRNMISAPQEQSLQLDSYVQPSPTR